MKEYCCQQAYFFFYFWGPPANVKEILNLCNYWRLFCLVLFFCLSSSSTPFKGQLNSEWIYEVIVSLKMQTKNSKDFFTTKQTRIIAKKAAYTHQKITKKSTSIFDCMVLQKSLEFLVCILGETMTS